MNKQAKVIARELRDFHQSNQLFADVQMDQLLGIPINLVEEQIPLSDILVRYGGEHRVYQSDNPYAYIRQLYQKLAPFQPKSLLDLGSEYGRLLLYGALLWDDVKFYGIEMVAERVTACQAVCQTLGLKDAIHCERGDAARALLPQADCICLLNSFFPAVLKIGLENLKRHAQKQDYLLVGISTGNLIIAKEDWLEEVPSNPPAENEPDFRFFRPR
ncbi:MAG: class I SAM-dependent methyltransferase [Bacteroidota bacterium]